MEKLRGYFESMLTDGWVFHNPYDETMKNIYWGVKGDFRCYLNLNNSRLEFWYKDKEWRIEPPHPYKYEDLEYNVFICDRCGDAQVNDAELETVNEYEKYCRKCITLNLTN